MRFLVILLLSSFTHVWAAERPNIIFIFADDWGWQDLSCHDHPYVKTPNIDRLAKEGRDFHRFSVASPVCSPSRVAVMTGHFPARYCVDGHFAWVPNNKRRGMPDWLDPAVPTLPKMLRDAGYATAHFGKWHLSNNMIPDAPPASEYGYDAYGTYNNSGEQMPYDHDVTRAISFMGDSVEEKKPFFINLWIHEPHTPFHVLPKFRQRFPELKNEADNIYAATLSYADDRIGELLDYLDKKGLTDNTIVIFSSDNGPARSTADKKPELMYDTATGAGFDLGAAKGLTGGRKGYKASLHEGGLNVPFLIRWPGQIQPNTKDDESIISAVDLLPTLVNLAGVSLPEGYSPDGIDLSKVFLGKPIKRRTKPLFTRYQPKTKDYPEHWAQYTVVSGQHKLLTAPKTGRVELYNLSTDPLEAHDIAHEKADLVTEMEGLLQEWLQTLPAKPSGNVFSTLRK